MSSCNHRNFTVRINGCNGQFRTWIGKQKEKLRLSLLFKMLYIKCNTAILEFLIIPAISAPGSRRSVEKRADGSLCHNTAVPLSQRSLLCSAPPYTPYTQSAQGATPHPELWSSKQQKSNEVKKTALNIVKFKGSRFTFPTMHLLHAAQWPLAVVRTPIFSRSELSPPSRSSIESVFCVWIEGFGLELAGPLLLLLSLSFCPDVPSSFFFFVVCFCVSGGGADGGKWF